MCCLILGKIIKKDITQRHKIYDKRAFINVVRLLVNSIGNKVLPNNILKVLKAVRTIFRAKNKKWLPVINR